MDLSSKPFADWYEADLEAEEKENLKKRLEADPEEEFIFEKYYDLLCSTQEEKFKSNYDFYKFLDDLYGDASYYAESCIIRMDVRKISELEIEVWFEHAMECITFLLIKFLSLEDLKNGKKHKLGGNLKREVYNLLQFELKGEWEGIGSKLNQLYNTRNSFKYKVNVRSDRKKMLNYRKKESSKVIREKAAERKYDFVEVHVDSLSNLKKAHPDYKKENGGLSGIP